MTTTKRKTPPKKAPSKKAPKRQPAPKDEGDFPLWVFEAVIARNWLVQIEDRMGKVVAKSEGNPHVERKTLAELKRVRTAMGKAVTILQPVQAVADKLEA